MFAILYLVFTNDKKSSYKQSSCNRLHISSCICYDYVSRQPHKGPESFLAPVAFISMFTLSAAMMGLIFGYQPFKLYFDGKKKEAISLLFKTILTFAVTTLILLALILGGVIGVK